jgi:hypothetical protein
VSHETVHSTGREDGEGYPEAESPERSDFDGTLCGQTWPGSPGMGKRPKGEHFQAKIQAKGHDKKGTVLRYAGTE